MENDWLHAEEDTLIYFGDTMCSWCYGFAPELSKFKANHPDIPLQIVHGGLRPHGTEKAVDMADFLKHHWDQITERTGLPFSYDILSDPNFIYDTEPAARACLVVREMKPEAEFDFFKAVQTGFYQESKDTCDPRTFLEIAKDFDLDPAEFERLYNTEEIAKATNDDFQLAAQMGISGYPSMVYKTKGQFFLMARGFMELEGLEAVMERIETEE